jgi:uncharacterized repeat protein (TIGR03803 family)
MRACTNNPFPLLLVLAILVWVLAGCLLSAQTLTTLHSFTGGSDGSKPIGGLTLSGNTLYGTTSGFNTGFGTVFKLFTDGTGFTNLNNFAGLAEGASPFAGLILSGTTLYGTTAKGGVIENGSVFALKIDGTGFTNLHSFLKVGFPYNEGALPEAGLIQSGEMLYGTASGGGGGSGVVFGVKTDGTCYTNLHSFTLTLASSPSSYTNSDGASPLASLVLSGNTLYGTASEGGGSGFGTVFAVNTDSTHFWTVHSFVVSQGTNNEGGIVYTNSEGGRPYGSLIVSGNTLYGTASWGGSSTEGTVFSVRTDGTQFKILHSFTRRGDGANPRGTLILSGNTLYGITAGGGISDEGTVFALNTDGTRFETLYSFSGGSDGGTPLGGLVLSSNVLFGTTDFGGISGNGTVFSLSLSSLAIPQLTIIASAADVILTWPTNAIGFSLQSTTNFAAPIWVRVPTAPVVLNGQNTVTNRISGTHQFYRLTQ